MSLPSALPDYPANHDIEMDPHGTWPASVHLFKPDTVAALRAAEVTGRPLLVRGLPGVGKSQTARAAAAYAKRRFVSVVIDGRTEARDLMWEFDAVARLADAQGRQAGAAPLPPSVDYVLPGPLWAAFHWQSAIDQHDRATRRESTAPHEAASSSAALPNWMHQPADYQGDPRTVLLMDEIDKADPDLPNALLEVLANDGFEPRLPGLPRVTAEPNARPLIIITTNEERDLPNAFLRRCLVITLELPKSETRLKADLLELAQRHQAFAVKRGLSRPDEQCSETVLKLAAQRLVEARQGAAADGYLPGASEYLDLIRALGRLHPGREDHQTDALETLKTFAYDKSLRIGGSGGV